MTQHNLKELAKQGNVKAIAFLMNRALQPKGITTKLQLKDNCLLVRLESDCGFQILIQYYWIGL